LMGSKEILLGVIHTSNLIYANNAIQRQQEKIGKMKVTMLLLRSLHFFF
jgi:hypothetical protein